MPCQVYTTGEELEMLKHNHRELLQDLKDLRAGVKD